MGNRREIILRHGVKRAGFLVFVIAFGEEAFVATLFSLFLCGWLVTELWERYFE
jgi:hypothetical protein